MRVYYEDTDAGGVVYYANYLSFMERARTEWLRALGFEQPALAAEHGVLFVVRAVNIDYLKPSRFNDSLQVTVEVVNVGGSRIRFLQRVLRGTRRSCGPMSMSCASIPTPSGRCVYPGRCAQQ